MPQPASSHAAALGLGVAGIALLGGMDAVIKHLGQTESPLTLTLGRYVFTLVFAVLIWARAGRPGLTGDIWRAHLIRGGVMALCSVSFIYALTVLPLAQATTILFVAPLLSPVLAHLMLKEPIQAASALALLVGFTGTALALLGQADDSTGGLRQPLGVGAALLAAITYALSMVLLRARAARDGSAVVGLMGALVPTLLLAGPALVLGGLPSTESLPGFALMGALGAASLWAMSEAYARAEAQQLAPLEFTALIWAALLGFVFFAEVPSPQLWIGGALIIGACLWVGGGGAAPERQGDK